MIDGVSEKLLSMVDNAVLSARVFERSNLCGCDREIPIPGHEGVFLLRPLIN
jgi:hypothetical protein